MEKLFLLQQLLGCIKNSKEYQNILRDTLLQIQQKLRWIALTKKRSYTKRENTRKKAQKKRLPYHPCFQLLNLVKTKVKRYNFPAFISFTNKELVNLENLYTIYGNNWDVISSKLNKSPLECYRNYIRKIKNKANNSNKIQWTEIEDSQLIEAVERCGKNNWNEVSNWVDGKNSSQCYHRYMKTLNQSIKRGKWDSYEDIKLLLGVKIFGTNWVKISELIKNRTDIQCRERYCNVLCPSINSSIWKKKEDFKLIFLILVWGKKWSKIAKIISGRTDNQCWRRSKYLMKTSMLLRGLVILRIFRHKKDKILCDFIGRLNSILH